MASPNLEHVLSHSTVEGMPGNLTINIYLHGLASDTGPDKASFSIPSAVLILCIVAYFIHRLMPGNNGRTILGNAMLCVIFSQVGFLWTVAVVFGEMIFGAAVDMFQIWVNFGG